jgi:hypothetical protein
MNIQYITVHEAFQNEAQNILNKLFQDDFGYFNCENVKKVQEFLPDEILNRRLFFVVSSQNSNINFKDKYNAILVNEISYTSSQYCLGSDIEINITKRIYIKQKQKFFLQKEIAKILEVSFFKKSYTLYDILKKPLFTQNFDGNPTVAESIIMECISSNLDITQEMIIIMNKYLSEKLFFNMNYNFFDKEIFVNAPNKTISFEIFDNDDIETSFTISQDIIDAFYQIQIVAEQNIKIRLQQDENHKKLKSILK